jgi:hypothetical protein
MLQYFSFPPHFHLFKCFSIYRKKRKEKIIRRKTLPESILQSLDLLRLHIQRHASPRLAMGDSPSGSGGRPLLTDSDWDGSSREGSPDADADAASPSGEALRTAADAGWWLGEIERQRVRLVRDWVHMAAREGGDDHHQPPPSAAGLRIRGRQARLELVMRLAADRHAELQRLALRRPVSGFPHRNRIHVRPPSPPNPRFHEPAGLR